MDDIAPGSIQRDITRKSFVLLAQSEKWKPETTRIMLLPQFPSNTRYIMGKYSVKITDWDERPGMVKNR